MTRGQALLLGLGVLALGGIGWWGFQASGLEGFTPGLAASALLTLVVMGWTASYLFRVVTGRMTYMEQRRRYRASYDAQTDAQLLARFEALPQEEQERLLRDLGQISPTSQITPPPTP